MINSEVEGGDGYMEGVDHHGVGIHAAGGALHADEEVGAVALAVGERHARGVDALVIVVPCDGGNQAVSKTGCSLMNPFSMEGNSRRVAVVVALGGIADGVVEPGVRPLVHYQFILPSAEIATPGRILTLVGIVVARRFDVLAVPGVGQGIVAGKLGVTHNHIHSTLHLQVQYGDAVAEEVRLAHRIVELDAGGIHIEVELAAEEIAADADGVVEVHAHRVGRLVQVVPRNGGYQAVIETRGCINRMAATEGNRRRVAIVVALGGGDHGVIYIGMRARVNPQVQSLAVSIAAARREGVVDIHMVAHLREGGVVPGVGQLVVTDSLDVGG